MEKKAIDNSSITVISSKGFENFLPAHDYVVAHNIIWLPPEVTALSRAEKKPNKPISLSYIGNMRFPEKDKEMLLAFANDVRYHISLFGRGYSSLESFCKEHEIKNVTIVDWFPPEKTLEFYSQTDIVLNLYGNDSPTVNYALSNKLYYSAQLGKPILVCPNTLMEKVTCEGGFGFSFDLFDSTAKDRLYDYYNSIDWKQFYDKCDAFLDSVKKEDNAFMQAVSTFLVQ